MGLPSRVPLALALLLAWTAPAAAQPPAGPARPPRPADPRAAAVEAEIAADMERVGPEAASRFAGANQARDRGELDRALDLYREAARLAPMLDHPRRRACSVLALLRRHDEAVAECEAALAIGSRPAFDQATLAAALLGRRGPGDAKRALELARSAASSDQADLSELLVWCQAALENERIDELRPCARRALAIDPDGLETNQMGSLAALVDGDLISARAALERSRRAGLPDGPYREMTALIDRGGAGDHGDGGGASEAVGGFLTTIAIAVGVWIAGLVLLLAAGWLLSRATLRAVDRGVASGQANADGSPGERRLRRIYRAVVVACGIYFYLSLPVLLVTVLGSGVGVVWLFLSAGFIPIKLVLVIGAVVLFTVVAIGRGLFVRASGTIDEHEIDLGAQPRLRELLDGVAAAIQTRPVDRAFLTPHTDLAVFELGGLWSSLRGGTSERCLLLGAGLFEGMRQIDLRSILGHEHGHFRNQDTAGGGFALAVRRSLYTMILRMAESGAAASYNPAWQFLRAYHRVYLIVTQGASRLQEVLADRWAVLAYGSDAFVRGFSHVVGRSVRFDRHVQATLRHVIEQAHPLPNLYRHEPPPRDPEQAEPVAEEAEVREQMEREPSGYDSHPAPRQRLAWAEAMAVPRDPEPGDDLPVWDLFEDRDALERAMTAQVRAAVESNHGAVIAG